MAETDLNNCPCSYLNSAISYMNIFLKKQDNYVQIYS